jgi:uncharacterized protein (DUF362 family)
LARYSRRDFLRLTGLGVLGAAATAIVTACGSRVPQLRTAPPAASPTTSPTDSPEPTPAATPTDTPAATDSPTTSPSATTSPSPSAIPDLVAVKGNDPETITRAAIEALGGMGRFVHPGAKVVVKPNVCVSYRTYQYAATTNPWVVGALVKMALEAGAASVSVMDFPYGGDATTAYATSGIAAQVKAAGGKMVVMSSRGWVNTKIPKGKWLKASAIYQDILKADVIINVPIAKTHGSARLTLGMKNLMGVVRDRSAMHGNLAQSIADLNTRIKPQLTVVDAVRILTANGPSGGRLRDVKPMNTVIASPDVVAADSYAARLFGRKPSDLAYVRIGASMGLGQSDLSKLNIREISL